MTTKTFRRKDNIEDLFPLSDLQKGFLSHAISGKDDPYYMQYAFEVSGTLSAKCFEAAWQDAADRHAMLRTDFQWEDLGQPVHIVYRRSRVSIQQRDWSKLDPVAQAAALTDSWASARSAGFDLAHGADLDVQLIQLGPERYWVVWRFHHIQLDGWSVALILREVLSDYAAHIAGKPPERRAAQSFRSCIAWLRQQERTSSDAWW